MISYLLQMVGIIIDRRERYESFKLSLLVFSLHYFCRYWAQSNSIFFILILSFVRKRRRWFWALKWVLIFIILLKFFFVHVRAETWLILAFLLRDYMAIKVSYLNLCIGLSRGCGRLIVHRLDCGSFKLFFGLGRVFMVQLKLWGWNRLLCARDTFLPRYSSLLLFLPKISCPFLLHGSIWRFQNPKFTGFHKVICSVKNFSVWNSADLRDEKWWAPWNAWRRGNDRWSILLCLDIHVFYVQSFSSANVKYLLLLAFPLHFLFIRIC